MAQQLRPATTKQITRSTTPKHRSQRLSWEDRERQARVIEGLVDSIGCATPNHERLDYYSITPGQFYGR
jgi:hypothetical protein